jgi:hypothetical protein
MRASYVSTGSATVDGRQVLVFTYAWGPDGSHLIRVDVDPQSCART